MSSITLTAVRKTFAARTGSGVRALESVSLEVADGETVVLLGPSGCGKTTLLRCVAGLEQPDAGEITIGGRRVFSRAEGVNLPPDQRDLGMVFQSYALWPHMTVFDNVAYPLKRRHRSPEEIARLVPETLRLVDCLALADRHPHEISGGQQQRVALARALASSPKVLLFDEPLSNLDATLRDRMRSEIRILQQKLHFTSIYVTHDQREALALADKLVVMGPGKVVQSGTPDEVYERPASVLVARFLGAANVIPVLSRVGADRVRTALGELVVTGTSEDTGAVVIRQEALAVGAAAGAPGVNVIEATVITSEFLGDHRLLLVDASGQRLQLKVGAASRLRPGDPCRLEAAVGACRVVPA